MLEEFITSGHHILVSNYIIKPFSITLYQMPSVLIKSITDLT